MFPGVAHPTKLPRSTSSNRVVDATRCELADQLFLACNTAYGEIFTQALLEQTCVNVCCWMRASKPNDRMFKNNVREELKSAYNSPQNDGFYERRSLNAFRNNTGSFCCFYKHVHVVHSVRCGPRRTCYVTRGLTHETVNILMIPYHTVIPGDRTTLIKFVASLHDMTNERELCYYRYA